MLVGLRLTVMILKDGEAMFLNGVQEQGVKKVLTRLLPMILYSYSHNRWTYSFTPYFQYTDCGRLSANPSSCTIWGNRVGTYGFTANQACCACGEGAQLIDVMVISQSSTQRVDMLNIINLSIYQTNIALSNSGTNGRLRLVRHYHNEVNFDSSGTMSTVLDRLRFDSNVARLRDDNGADLVHFIGDNIESGIGYLYESYFGRSIGFAASRTNRAAQSGDYTFAHETGNCCSICIFCRSEPRT